MKGRDMKKRIRTLLCASVATAPWAMSTPALAADQPAAEDITLEEIVVTAQRREENLQRVPIAVTSVSADDLAASNVKSIQDLTTLVSGFVGPGDNGMQSPHIRGIGSQVGSPGLENSVALYVDGVYIGATTPALLGLNNIAQVDVLKGPQGTLFGRNTTGGLVQITTRDPSDVRAVEAELGYANYSTASASLYVNAPLNSSIATNLAIQTSNQGEGWGKNLLNGQDVYRTDLNLAIRNKWNFNLSDATKFQFVADYEKRNETGTFAYRPITGSTVAIFNGPPNTPAAYTSTVAGWDVNSQTDQRNRTVAYGFSGRLSRDLGFATLSDTLAYRNSKFDLLAFDADKTPLDNFSIDWHTSNKQWTNELQLASNSTGPLKWTTGVFYYHAVDDTFQPLTWGTLAPSPPGLGKFQQVITTSEITTESLAGYGQADYKIASATTLTAGYRYSHDKHRLAGTHATIAATFSPPVTPLSNAFSKDSQAWRLAVSQQLADAAMVYASYNRGVKAGGYNPVVVENVPYDDEQLDTYEIGSKLTFLDDRARLNVAGFYNKYKNIQVQRFEAAGPPTIYNGAGAKSYGVDVDFEVRPISALKIRSTFEALRSEFTNFTNADLLTALPGGGYSKIVGSASGNALPYAPEFTASLAPTYTIPVSYGSYDLSGTWSYSSGFTTTPGLELEQSAYNLLGASVQFTDSAERSFVRLWGSNLGDKEVAMNLSLSETGTYVGLLAPRTFGITVGAKF